mmetsp:Transcript_15590/g.49737  ORF Transcript_15590/g.49737 Transcript_15590/m.49737 type:complete len:231 (+) Transcript_15590:1109-1801(+)
MVPTPNNDQVLDATAYEELVPVEKAKVASPEPLVFALSGCPGLVLNLRMKRLASQVVETKVPFRLGSRVYPDFAHLILRQRLRRLLVHDAHLDAVRCRVPVRVAAADHPSAARVIAGHRGGLAGGKHVDATLLLEHDLVHKQALLAAVADIHSVLGEPVPRGHSALAEAELAKRALEVVERVHLDRLRRVENVAQRGEVELGRDALALLELAHHELVRKVRRLDVGRPVL